MEVLEKLRLRPGSSKSTYANNVLQQPGEKIDDLKITNAKNLRKVRAAVSKRWVFSYSDQGFRTGLLDELRRIYPEPCPLEREGA